MAFDVKHFRALTAKIIAAEKPGFWSDWTPEQQAAYMSGDWRAFSESRGYSAAEIAEYAEWQGMIEAGKETGLNPYALIHDLAMKAAIANIKRDVRGEILLSSHIILNGRRCFSGVASCLG